MKGHLLIAAGSVVVIGLFFPAWKQIDRKEAEGKENYGIYEQICALEQDRDLIDAHSIQAQNENEEFLEKLKPYEEKLKTAHTVKQQLQKEMDMPITSGSDVFLKIPYTLDVDGIVKSYDDSKKSVGFSTALGNLGGVVGKFFGSITAEGTEDFAEEESMARIQLSNDMYKMAVSAEREAEDALLEYWTLSGYRDNLLNTEEDGELLSGIMILEKFGDMTEDERDRISQAEDQAVNALAKLDFILNIYYDFSRDSMIDGTQNALLLAQVSEVRDTISGLLGDRDLSSYGYTQKEKKDIVFPVIEEWMQMVDACYMNASVEYEGGSAILYSSNDWHDLNYQTKAGQNKMYPRRVVPHFAANMTKHPVWVYFSGDKGSRHRAYYVKVYGTEYYYYQTDRGEEITDYGGDDEDGEARMTKTDNVYNAIIKQNSGWQNTAGRYLE